MHVLPGAEEPPERRRLDRLDLLAQPGQGAAAQPAQHLGVAPLGAGARRPELAVEHPALTGEPLQGVAGHRGAEAEPLGHLGGGERAVGAGEPGDEVGQRVVDRLGEHLGRARRHRDAEAVAQPGDVLHDRPPLGPRHPHLHHPPGVDERGEPAVGVGVGDAARRAPRRRRADRAGAAGRRGPRRRGRGGRGRAAAAPPPPPRAPRGRAARAARRGRAARPAGPGRARAPPPGARRWGSRPRRRTGRRSRTAGCRRTARGWWW